jgi:hypothetical protein
MTDPFTGADDMADQQREAIKTYLDELDDFDERIDELRTGDRLDLPAGLQRGLRELEVLLTRLRYRFRDELQKLK